MCYLLHSTLTTDHLLSRDFVPSAIDAEELHQCHEREVRYELSDSIVISAAPPYLQGVSDMCTALCDATVNWDKRFTMATPWSIPVSESRKSSHRLVVGGQ